MHDRLSLSVESRSRARRSLLAGIAVLGVLTLCACGGGGGGESGAATSQAPTPVSGGNNSGGGNTGSSSGNIELAWTPPTTKADGSVLNDLAGYRFYIGRESGQYNEVISIDNGGLSRFVIENLQSGTWYVVMSSVRANGVESDLSNEVAKPTN